MDLFGKKLHEMNDDGISIKGCDYIYSPKGQAGEYAVLSANPYRGCSHKCAYCYVPQILRMDRNEFYKGAFPRENFLCKLEKDAIKYKDNNIREQVMLSFTTDPYHPLDNSLTRQTILKLQTYGLGVCTLTKGGSRALRDISLFRSDRDAFASTLTSLNDDFSKKWESGASLPNDRIETLKKFSEKGIYTWVSLEPTLDCDASIEIIKQTYQFVNLYKIGRVNYLPMTKTTDWKDYTLRIIDICQKLNVEHYIKKDLQCYLPEGYVNKLRVKQHF